MYIMNPNGLSIRPALTFAWSTWQKHFGLFAALLLTGVGAWIVLEVVVIAGQSLGIVWWAAAHLLFLLFFAGLTAACLRIGLALYDGGQPRYRDAFRHYHRAPAFLAGQFIYLGLLGFGLLLLVVPGLFVGTRFVLSGFSLAAGETGLLQSFPHSARLTAGSGGRLLAVLGALLGLNVLGTSLLGLGLFVTLPLSVLILAALYRQLSAGLDQQRSG